jgi:hypothetical protein
MQKAMRMLLELQSVSSAEEPIVKKRRITPIPVTRATDAASPAPLPSTLIPAAQPSSSRSAIGSNPSLREEVIHNRFELERRFSNRDTNIILREARARVQVSQFRFVHFGAEDGYLLILARDLWKDLDVVYIGVEGGTKVSGPSTSIESAKKYDFIHGMQTETLFEEIEATQHAAMTQSPNRKTVALLYDGGILGSQPIDTIVQVVDHFVPGSVVIFVTEKGSLGSVEQADSRYIKKNMIQRGWARILTLPVCETDDATVPTMQALFFMRPTPISS